LLGVPGAAWFPRDRDWFPADRDGVAASATPSRANDATAGTANPNSAIFLMKERRLVES
jgi:hypothetical protein